MGRIKLYRMISVLLIGLALSACSAVPRVADYRSFGFRGEVAWESEGVRVVALAEVAAPSEGGDRGITLTFTSPPSLAGIVLRGTDDRTAPIRVEFGALRLEEAAFGTLWDMSELLLPMGEFRSVCRSEENGAELIYAEIVQTKEEGNGAEQYELYLAAESGAPRRIRCGERQMEFHSFEFLR